MHAYSMSPGGWAMFHSWPLIAFVPVGALGGEIAVLVMGSVPLRGVGRLLHEGRERRHVVLGSPTMSSQKVLPLGVRQVELGVAVLKPPTGGSADSPAR